MFWENFDSSRCLLLGLLKCVLGPVHFYGGASDGNYIPVVRRSKKLLSIFLDNIIYT